MSEGVEQLVATAGESQVDADGAARLHDARSIHRIPIRLAVSQRGLSAPLGVTRDLSLRGAFIETTSPLPVGTIVPLAIELAHGEPALELEAEVIRVTEVGMGLAFMHGEGRALRRLRRWIVDRTSVQGTQRQVEQLHDHARNVAPLTCRVRIEALLVQLRRARAPIMLIPVDRLVRDEARLGDVTSAELRLTTRDPSLVGAGEEVFALAQLGYVSYSFALRVRDVQPAKSGSVLVAQLPASVVYSERRTKERAPVPPGTLVRWPAAWDPERTVARPVLEANDHGLSFRVAEAECLLAPGAPLTDATLVSPDGHEVPLVAAEVRNITRVVEPDGAAWLRVGVSFGGGEHRALVEIAQPAQRHGPFAWLARIFGRARVALSYGLHKGKGRLIGDGPPAQRVTIVGGPHPLVGLLDRTRADERLHAPLVVVVPGFGGRKEQMSFLAGTIVDGFARQHHDVAVLRFDGSNNIGESGKDEGCAGDGMHALHYTVSGLVDDVLAVLAWARKNPLVTPTHIVLVSASMGSIAVRHVLTRPEAADVGLWVSYMGAPDAVDSVRLVSGNVDLHAYWQRGQTLGVVSLAGMLTDGDRFWRDLQRLDIGDIAAAEREMARIRADVVWLYGRHDAFMDPRRVQRIMCVPPPAGAKRELIEVDSGHLPRTGDEALAQFVRLTRRIWQHVHHTPMEPFAPSLGRLAAVAAAEWKQVRSAAPADRGDWWRRYLLDPEGLGFDVLEHAAPYRELMDRQADRLQPPEERDDPRPLLDVGAGTGNLLVRLFARGAARVVATDLVPEALAAAQQKADAHGCGARLTTRIGDADGSPLVAVRRFLAGDLTSARELAERVPGIPRATLERLLGLGDDAVHAALRGYEVDLPALARARHLAAHEVELLDDLGRLARFVRAAPPWLDAPPPPPLTRIPPAVLASSRGLPFPDGSVRAVGLSLLLSYLDHPDDLLFEVERVLAPGGRLVVSSLVPDYDSSKLYLSLVRQFESVPEAELPAGVARATLIASARHFVDHAAELFRLAEEGLFRLYDATSLVEVVRRRGFLHATAELAFGDPPQAVIVTCRRA